MKLNEVLKKIAHKPIGTKYVCSDGSYVKVIEENKYEIAPFGRDGVKFVVEAPTGFEGLTGDKWVREIVPFDFSEAIKNVKCGRKVCRLAWPIDKCIGLAGYTFDPTGIELYMHDGQNHYRKINSFIPTQEDMVANDWCLYSERID